MDEEIAEGLTLFTMWFSCFLLIVGEKMQAKTGFSAELFVMELDKLNQV